MQIVDNIRVIGLPSRREPLPPRAARLPGGTVIQPPAARGIRCMMMRGGTSKGLYFLASDLPGDPAQRDSLLVRIMGSGHPLQIDGLGGAHSLASKVAVISPSPADVGCEFR